MNSKTLESKLISNSTALLLGAGFSIPFGMPSTEDLTKLVTSEKVKFVKINKISIIKVYGLEI